MPISTAGNGKRSGSRTGGLFGALMVAALVFLTLLVFAAERSRVVFVRVGPTNIGLFVAEADEQRKTRAADDEPRL